MSGMADVFLGWLLLSWLWFLVCSSLFSLLVFLVVPAVSAMDGRGAAAAAAPPPPMPPFPNGPDPAPPMAPAADGGPPPPAVPADDARPPLAGLTLGSVWRSSSANLGACTLRPRSSSAASRASRAMPTRAPQA